jgi:bifunctional pyridoxal-dependent enzyme with beta-cystathionase and maltose regulon repressor activities
MVNMSSAKQQTAGDLMIDLARIQKATGAKRTALLAKAKQDWAGKVWSNEELARWARWAWKEGVR